MGVRRPSKFLLKRLLLICSWVLVVAAFSHVTTLINWSGVLDLSGEGDLWVKGPDGVAIANARVSVTDHGKEVMLPFFEGYGDGGADSPTSDRDGHLRLKSRISVGCGGERWRLFWVFRMGTWGGPEFHLRVSADGFVPEEILLEKVLQSSEPIVIILRPTTEQ